ncbi:MAG: CopD family protein [Candidatus Curtissbacteria bacterium]|nr:CopD family protein [Candidatus Curtissbacteria bacterium]
MEEKILLFLHTMATSAWIGGMIFLSFLGNVVEKLGPQYGVVMGRMTKIFSKIALASIIVLAITGIMLTGLHGGVGRVQRDPVLNFKHLAILLVIINGAILSAKIVPSLEKLSAEKSPKAKLWQKRLKIHSTINLILGILIVLLAII